jgi:CDP-2,3-bis-(O-geranylgeranyl)-sn-glycerol synthase
MATRQQAPPEVGTRGDAQRISLLLGGGALLLGGGLLATLPHAIGLTGSGMLGALLAAGVLTAGQFLPPAASRRNRQPALVLPLVIPTVFLLAAWPRTTALGLALAPLLLRVYLVTTPAWFLLAWLGQARGLTARRAPFLGALPVLLVGGLFLLLGIPLGLDRAAVGLAITYANLGAALTAGGRPLDGGRRLRDGRRLLGDGKTVRGTLGGLALATLAATAAGLHPLAGLAVGALVLAGDAAASVLKRRVGLASGAAAPLLDQWDGLLPLLALTVLTGFPALTPPGALLLALGTLFVQRYGNALLFLLGRKGVPW